MKYWVLGFMMSAGLFWCTAGYVGFVFRHWTFMQGMMVEVTGLGFCLCALWMIKNEAH